MFVRNKVDVVRLIFGLYLDGYGSAFICLFIYTISKESVCLSVFVFVCLFLLHGALESCLWWTLKVQIKAV